MQCENCKSKNISIVDDYRLNVEFDKKYFKNLKIAHCKDCKFSFAFPVPDSKILNEYYSNIYRSDNRPHIANISEEFTDQFLGYMSSLTTFVDISKIKKVYEIGPGTGMFGLMLKKLNPDINIYCIEPDSYSQGILRQRGYEIIDDNDDNSLDNSIDLVISIHSMEHFPSLKDFNNSYFSKLKEGGYVFLEVPNCRFHEAFIDRPYDSPHLLFFNKESISAYAYSNNLKEISIVETSNSLDVAFKSMSEWKSKYSKWDPSKSRSVLNLAIIKLKMLIKFLLNNIFRIEIRKLADEVNPDSKIANFYHNNPNGWCLRGLLRK